MKLYGQELSREELLKRNNPGALYGARKLEITEGPGRGQRYIDVKTAGGLHATFSQDRCLDIVDLEYKGVNLAFLGKNGYTGTATAGPETDSFVKYVIGGFLFTSGLRNSGPPCSVDGEFFPVHGHIGVMPADNVNVFVCEKEIVITGVMKESALFGHNLELVRKITIPSDGAKITVTDTINNLRALDEPVFLLYHINFGYPFLSEELKADFPEGEIKGRNEVAQAQMDVYDKFVTPLAADEPETVYFHLPKDKNPTVHLTNGRLGIKADVSYDASKMPVLVEWRSMAAGDYALGIEPSTSFIRGRKEELENDYSVKVPAFGSLSYGFTVSLGDI